ncbi:hypothetical protein [Desulfovibrio sp. TomC]|uniref:hypothetical protein n=1 Tax=Desulfovibrio sp. TomC TaxID=1562888 RepID=UPI0018CF0096|nr:hypothetical protein [Desulfovibrio sp. TomC]
MNGASTGHQIRGSATSHRDTLPSVRTSGSDQQFVPITQMTGCPVKRAKRPDKEKEKGRDVIPAFSRCMVPKGGLGTFGTKPRSNSLILYDFKNIY